MKKDLIKLSNRLYRSGLTEESASIGRLIQKVSFLEDTDSSKRIDPPVEIAKRLDEKFSSVYEATSGILARQLLDMDDLSSLITVGNWFYYKPSDLYYYFGDHGTNKLFIVESKNSYLQLRGGTNRRAEPTWFKKLKDEHKEYFLPIQKEYEFEGYKVFVMPLPERYNPKFHKELIKGLPDEIFNYFEDDVRMTIDLGVLNGKLLITEYEGDLSRIDDYLS
jgi:hypothetical protein